MTRSAMWKKYIVRLSARVIILAAAILMYFFRPARFSALHGLNFFRQFSLLHLLWLFWMFEMLLQLIPSRQYMALGAQKHLACHYIPGSDPEPGALRSFVRNSNRGALRVALVWIALIAVIGALYLTGLFPPSVLLLISIFFFLCDLICVLFWCPFQVFFMKNRCCTTCRIFNWDHLMMFSPLIFIPSFFALSLVAMSVLVILVWEVQFARHPERFWDKTNHALRCAGCTDRLCATSACIDRTK